MGCSQLELQQFCALAMTLLPLTLIKIVCAHSHLVNCLEKGALSAERKSFFTIVIYLQVVVKAEKPPCPNWFHDRQSQINGSMFHALVDLVLDIASVPLMKLVAHKLLDGLIYAEVHGSSSPVIEPHIMIAVI